MSPLEATGVHLDRENPWPGLEAFDEAARDYFHGREQEAERLVRQITDSTVTVLFGRSGLGKTSLLKAGVFPRLRDRHFLPVYVRFDIRLDAAPLASQIRASIAAALEANAVDAPRPADDEPLWEYLHRTDLELWSTRNYPLTLVLVLDQFEEVFTLGERTPDLVLTFRDELGDLAENRIPARVAERIGSDPSAAARLDVRQARYKLVLSLREDFLADLESWRRFIPAIGRSRARLLSMRPEQAFEAVYTTAPHLLDQDLARRIVAIVAGEDLRGARPPAEHGHDEAGAGTGGVEPALLSLFCRGLNEARKKLGRDRFDTHLLEGTQRDILSNYYVSCVEDLPERVARFIETELITENGFRNSFAREDAVPKHLTEEELGRLIRMRLLRLEERYGAQRIELTHDVLTRAVRDHRDRRRSLEEREALAARADEERRALADAARRREAEREAEFEAQRRLEREQRLESEAQAGRRFKRLAAALAAALVLAIGLAAVALTQRAAATREKALADDARGVAERERANARAQQSLAEERLTRITDGIRMKQAVLTGDRASIREFLATARTSTDLAFTVRATSRGYRDATGREIYRFQLMPGAASPDALKGIATVTYRMDHPTFRNSLMTTG
ncbi:MAG: hypothetical protein AB7I13_20755, partial [Vicinamibacterales bacterium]